MAGLENRCQKKMNQGMGHDLCVWKLYNEIVEPIPLYGTEVCLMNAVERRTNILYIICGESSSENVRPFIPRRCSKTMRS